MTSSRTKLAVIGLGMASKPHLAALLQLRSLVEVGGIFSRQKEHREQVAKEYGFPTYDSIEAICADRTIDGVIVITPPNARLEIVEMLAKAGKHILMEKPVERSLRNARQIVDICEKANVTLGIVLQHRFRAGASKLSNLLQSGALGPIYLARMTLPWWRDQSYYEQGERGTYAADGGGVLITQAIHVLDLMLSLIGPVRAVSAVTGTTPLHDIEVEDFASANLFFKNGAMGSVVATTASYPGGAETLHIDSENAALRLTAGELIVEWRDGRSETFGDISNTGGGRDPMDFPCDWHRDLIANFATCLHQKRAPRITGREALEVHRLIDAIECSAKKEGCKVLLEGET